MSAMASQITGVSFVYSTACSGAYQRQHQSCSSLAFVRGIHRWPVKSPHKGPVTRKMFPFDDVIMEHESLNNQIRQINRFQYLELWITADSTWYIKKSILLYIMCGNVAYTSKLTSISYDKFISVGVWEELWHQFPNYRPDHHEYRDVTWIWRAPLCACE